MGERMLTWGKVSVLSGLRRTKAVKNTHLYLDTSEHVRYGKYSVHTYLLMSYYVKNKHHLLSLVSWHLHVGYSFISIRQET